MSGVYVIRCVATGQVYVGRSHQLDKRVRSHLPRLRAGRHPNAALQAAWDEHGESCFEVTTYVLGIGASELRRLELDLVVRTGAPDPARGFNVRAVV